MAPLDKLAIHQSIKWRDMIPKGPCHLGENFPLASLGRFASVPAAPMRELFKLPETPYSDTLISCCCCVCGSCQEYRELQNRGVDPSLGWEGNVEKWKREGVTVPPIPTFTMSH
uniref:Protein PLANT CADMIUM RESISTANCE 12-like n=1 Tax=Nicotiana sylvestris TaxID=4096 RepID=A0A1U7VVN7_NICSY|nr:PREDICTED: protein PLANT CADMIUM RESISTANCE 12-like [Nicotiana sylvestris]